MATGTVENWAGTIADIGPMYPFVGSEFLLWIIGVVLWLLWHVAQSRIENRQYREEIQRYGDKATLQHVVAREDPDNP